ncbi:hypothetical protein AB0D08_39240 [Kitasatospora sp. NPDC048540]|uniref:hypothetical protein n=1 Tax=Kitasatospora sp. NPDC048540 TaxID=3155634 RepID=UPI0033EA1470
MFSPATAYALVAGLGIHARDFRPLTELGTPTSNGLGYTFARSDGSFGSVTAAGVLLAPVHDSRQRAEAVLTWWPRSRATRKTEHPPADCAACCAIGTWCADNDRDTFHEHPTDPRLTAHHTGRLPAEGPADVQQLVGYNTALLARFIRAGRRPGAAASHPRV